MHRNTPKLAKTKRKKNADFYPLGLGLVRVSAGHWYISVLIVWRPPLGRYTQSDGCSDLGSGRCCGIYLLRGHWHLSNPRPGTADDNRIPDVFLETFATLPVAEALPHAPREHRLEVVRSRVVRHSLRCVCNVRETKPRHDAPVPKISEGIARGLRRRSGGYGSGKTVGGGLRYSTSRDDPQIRPRRCYMTLRTSSKAGPSPWHRQARDPEKERGMWLLQKVSGPAARPCSVSGLQVDAGGVFSLWPAGFYCAGWLLWARDASGLCAPFVHMGDANIHTAVYIVLRCRALGRHCASALSKRLCPAPIDLMLPSLL